MNTVIENNRAVGSSAYWGERGHWFIGASQHRDSDALARSNFACFQQALDDSPAVDEWATAHDGNDAYAVESFNHWAVGWCEYLLINPECPPAIELADSLRARLEDYPVLDEEHWSQLECDEANDIWRDCYRVKDRLEYIRKHRSQFEFRDLRDMLSCVRGRYFAGYASELLH